ncbi:MAG: monovalent cation/H(+) antiporter subunit G [Proteobacteria bacterium]|jgi:multicomponent Na+:H+ antiporter subunit G|nr:monovalent cation/H(+) antiporter subunit G [Pseudomonadota bacterium]
MILSFLSGLFLVLGALFLLLAGIGAWVFPDFFTRMAAVSKASTLGVTLILIGALFHCTDSSSVMKVTAALFFLFLANPVASHLLGRVAYKNKIPLHPSTQDQGQDLWP